MLLELTEEQRLLQQTVRQMAQERIAPRVQEIDQEDQLPEDILGLLHDQGLISLRVPEEYGGGGVDVTTLCLVLEELAKVSAGLAVLPCIQATMCHILNIGASPDQKAHFFSLITKGKKTGALAQTEPSAGSDAGAIKTRAVLDGDHYILNGAKCFISNGDRADFVITFARTTPGKGARGISCFLVDRDTPGFSIGKKEDKMGLRGTAAVEVIFQDAPVPKENLLGAPHEGFKIVLRSFNQTRVTIATLALGIAEGALEYALRYAQERVQFNQPIFDFQAIQFMLADMATRTEAARGLIYQAAANYDRGSKDNPVLSAMAKCYATDVAMQVSIDAVQILGGYGYMKDHPVERMMRDAKGLQILEGTNQIQRMVIARGILP